MTDRLPAPTIPPVAHTFPFVSLRHASCDAPASVIEARYANHFEVGHNEYEFIFDFDQFHFERPGAVSAESAPQVRIIRIVMGPAFAKSLLETLMRSVDEYEHLHGPIDQS